MYQCKHFHIMELVDPETFDQKGDGAWSLFNDNALRALDDLREYFNAPITVNNWNHGGTFRYRGYRPESCHVGAPKSEHRKGNAFDCDIRGYSAHDARRIIFDNKDNPLLKRIMRMEGAVTWLHFDLKPVEDRIHVFQV